MSKPNRYERLPKAQMLAKLKDIAEHIKKLHDESESIRYEMGWCSCGQWMPRHLDYEGWLHGYETCSPPPEGSKRCSCGFVLIRAGEKSWTTSSYLGDEDDRISMIHQLNNCWESID
jgi:hypothetical protein